MAQAGRCAAATKVFNLIDRCKVCFLMWAFLKEGIYIYVGLSENVGYIPNEIAI